MLAAALAVAVVTALPPSSPPPSSSPPSTISRHQCATHPMRYLLALPAGWTAGREWPVVVVIADAHRDFAENLKRFVEARGSRPYVLVAPEVLTCGGTRDLTSPPYSYTPEEWHAALAGRDYDFDDAGLAAILAEVHEKWGGDARAHLTGWEAGGHTVWAQTFRRPERWLAVAPVTPNYLGRGLSSDSFSSATWRSTLPIQVFLCGTAERADAAQAMQNLRQQTERALSEARAHGFTPAPLRVVAGSDHGPLPEPVLAWFDSLAERRATNRE